MIHIILLILKIIGIVLLAVLGILILAIVCAMFVPVRYRISVIREEGEGKPPVMGYVKITWLLHLLNILVRYPSKVIVRARLFIFTLYRMPANKKKTVKKEKAGKSEKAETPSRHEKIQESADENRQESHEGDGLGETLDAHRIDGPEHQAVAERRETAAVSPEAEAYEPEREED